MSNGPRSTRTDSNTHVVLKNGPSCDFDTTRHYQLEKTSMKGHGHARRIGNWKAQWGTPYEKVARFMGFIFNHLLYPVAYERPAKFSNGITISNNRTNAQRTSMRTVLEVSKAHTYLVQEFFAIRDCHTLHVRISSATLHKNKPINGVRALEKKTDDTESFFKQSFSISSPGT